MPVTPVRVTPLVLLAVISLPCTRVPVEGPLAAMPAQPLDEIVLPSPLAPIASCRTLVSEMPLVRLPKKELSVITVPA